MKENDLDAYEHANKLYTAAAKLRALHEPVYIERMKQNKELFTSEMVFEALSELHIPIIAGIESLQDDFMRDAHVSFTEEQQEYWSKKVNEFKARINEHFIALSNEQVS